MNLVKRFIGKMRNPEDRKVFFTIFGSKMVGVALLFLVMAGVSSYMGSKSSKAYAADESAPVSSQAAPASAAAPANAAPAAVAEPAPYVNPINTMWVLIAAFLVFFMQSGFMMLEAGFARSRETVNILLEGIVDTCLCGVLFWAWGFAWMFGAGNGFIGDQYYFLKGIPDTYGSTGIATLAFFLFQFAFADCTSTITSGSMVGRTGFWGDLVYSFVVSGFIYPILGHWAWGPDGWLALYAPAAFRDFAGSTVIHTIGGMIALAGAMALGPRIGRVFKRDGGGPMPGHDMTIAAVGTIILWFGWYGFNPGSTLSAMDMLGIARVACNTTLAAVSGGLAALFYVYPRNKIWDCGMTCNGILAGLVAITCPCYWVSPGGSLIIGVVAGILVVVGTDVLEYLRIDDPVGAVPVHGVNGIWGTLSLGLFATGQYGLPTPLGPDNSPAVLVKGLFYGGGFTQLKTQIIGNVAIGGAALIAGLVLMYSLKAIGILRVSKEGELQGLDIHEHGGSAYPELSSELN